MSKYDNDGQYANSGIPRYEWIFGKDYIGPGGERMTETLAGKLTAFGLEGKKFLDIGSGIGGACFFFHDRFNCEVVGVDLAPGMVDCANARRGERARLTFVLGDAATADVGGDFDFAYSRDSILHVEDKARLFARVHELLKPGGVFLFTDYAERDDGENAGEEWKTYVQAAGYHLYGLSAYKELVAAAGFDVQLTDFTAEFLGCLEEELGRLHRDREAFLREFSQEDFEYLEQRWEKKIRMVKSGDMKWSLMICQKK